MAARIAMASRSIDHVAAESLIEEAKAHCTQSGQSPWDAFGSPQDFAAATVAEQPASVRAGRDLQGNTPGEYVSGALFILAMQAVLAPLAVAVVDSTLSLNVTVAGLVGTLAVVMGVFVACAAPGAFRAAGHPRLAAWSFTVVAALTVGGALAFVELPRTRLATVPLLLITAIGVIGAWLLIRPERTDPSRPASLSTTEDDRLALETDPDDDHQWFKRLHGLLVGRFDVPKERAAQFVDEARSHLEATGTSPGEEYGPVAVYAMNLAAGEQQRRGPWWRSHSGELAVQVMVTLATLALSLRSWNAGREWLAVGLFLVALGLAGSAVTLVRRLLP